MKTSSDSIPAAQSNTSAEADARASLKAAFACLRCAIRNDGADGWRGRIAASNRAEGEITRALDSKGALSARLFQGDCFARSFLKWAEQMRSVGRTLPGLEARESEARAFLTASEAESDLIS